MRLVFPENISIILLKLALFRRQHNLHDDDWWWKANIVVQKRCSSLCRAKVHKKVPPGHSMLFNARWHCLLSVHFIDLVLAARLQMVRFDCQTWRVCCQSCERRKLNFRVMFYSVPQSIHWYDICLRCKYWTSLIHKVFLPSTAVEPCDSSTVPRIDSEDGCYRHLEHHHSRRSSIFHKPWTNQAALPDACI